MYTTKMVIASIAMFLFLAARVFPETVEIRDPSTGDRYIIDDSGIHYIPGESSDPPGGIPGGGGGTIVMDMLLGNMVQAVGNHTDAIEQELVGMIGAGSGAQSAVLVQHGASALNAIAGNEALIAQGEASAKATDTRNIGKSNTQQSTPNSPTGGDPVRLATGELVVHETDIRYMYVNAELSVQRLYASGGTVCGSLGSGWSFNYDTRIVRGVNTGARQTADFARAKEVQAHEAYESIRSEYAGMYGETYMLEPNREALQEQRATAERLLAEINQSIVFSDALYHAIRLQSSSEQRVDLLAELNSEIERTELLQSRIEQIIVDLDTMLANMSPAFSQVQELYGEWQAVKTIADRLEKEALLSESNAAKNRYSLLGGEPDYYTGTGNGTVTLIDEQGVPRLFSIGNAPEFDSRQTHGDGSKNYYPFGSVLVPAAYSEETLTLLEDGSFERRKKDGTVLTYDMYGSLLRATDRNGNEIAFLRNGNRELIRVRDGFGRTLRCERENGRIARVVDPLGRVVRYEYDGAGRLISVTDAAGSCIRYQYSGSLLQTILKPDGAVRRYEYGSSDGKPVVVKTVDEEGNSETFEYYPVINTTVYRNPSGIRSVHRYDNGFRETHVEYPDGSIASKTYDTEGRLSVETDALGRSKGYSYDAYGNTTEIRYADGTDERWWYGPEHDVTMHKDREGNYTEYTYDRGGNPISVKFPDGSTVSYRYSSAGLKEREIDGRGNAFLYSYDANGYLSATYDPFGKAERFTYDSVGNLIRHEDRCGAVREYEYDGDNRIVKEILQGGESKVYEYNARKDLIRETDEAGNSIFYVYDKRHLLIRVENAEGEYVVYRYREDGKLIGKDIGGEVLLEYGYDACGNLKEFACKDSEVRVVYEYDAAGQLIAETDGIGNKTRYEYNAQGLVSRIIYADGTEKWLGYTGNGHIAWIRDENGNTHTYGYDALGRLILSRDPEGGTLEYGYDRAGNIMFVRNGNKQERKYRYDSLNRVEEDRDHEGRIKRFEYDAEGRVTKIVDRNGHERRFSYDAMGRLIGSTDGEGGTLGFQYGPGGTLLKITDAKENAREFGYDKIGRLREEKDGYGNSATYEYTALGMLRRIVDREGNETVIDYDRAGRAVRIQQNGLSVQETDYDAAGNILRFRSSPGIDFSFEYDARNRVIKEIRGGIEERRFRRDGVGNIVGIVNGSVSEYLFSYDACGRLLKETNRLGASMTYQYDGAGNIVKTVDFAGTVMAFEYDHAGRITEMRHGNGTVDRYAYDGEGNLLRAENGAGKLEFRYDQANRLIEVWDSAASIRLRYVYDGAGNRVRMEQGGRAVLYAYGRNNELIALSDWGGKKTTFAYDKNGREIMRELPNGTVRETVYNAVGMVSGVRTLRGVMREPVWAEAYVYNVQGQRTHTIDMDGAITSYSYDGAGRLTQAKYPYRSGKPALDANELSYLGLSEHREQSTKSQANIQHEFDAETLARLKDAYERIVPVRKGFLNPDPAAWAETFDYDSRGNRTQKNTAWGSVRYVYDEADRMIKAGNRNYAYDANGNLVQEAISGEEILYRYDSSNRIEAVIVGKTERTDAGIQELKARVSYTYDALGRRNARMEERRYGTTEVGFSVHRFAYEGLGRDMVLETDEHRGFGRDDETMKKKSVSGDGRFRYMGTESGSSVIEKTRSILYAEGGIHSASEEHETVYYETDVQGSVRAYLDAGGAVKDSFVYDAFGSAYEGDVPTSSLFGYSGKQIDPTTDHYYFGFRDYAAVVGRFTSQDPIRDGMNWYAFVYNDPVNLIDPDGLDPHMNGGRPMGRIIQQEVPGGSLDACYYRALQAVAETYVGKNLSWSQVKDAAGSLIALQAMTSDFTVKDSKVVINDAFQRLGYPQYSVVFDTVPGNAVSSVRKVVTNNGNTHFQLGDEQGNLVWDPWGRNIANPNKAIEIRYIQINTDICKGASK